MRAALDEDDKPVVVRAVHANAGVQAFYYDSLKRLIDAMHDEVQRHVLAAYGSAESPEIAQDAENPSILIKRALAKWGNRWISKFEGLSALLAKEFANKSFKMTQTQMRAALKEAGFTVKFTTTPASAAAYQAIIAEQVNLIKSIPQEYLKDVQSKVWTSVMRGADMYALGMELHKSYGISIDRAATIARDQNQKAKAILEKARRQELGITHAIWQHSAGGKTPRKTHVAMTGKAYPIAQGMWDSDEGAYVMPGELINCRCSSKAIIPAFETVEQAVARAREGNSGHYIRAARRRAR